MEIRFNFEIDKSVRTMAFIAQRLGQVEKVKMMKLVYLADKEHFLKHGYPITGDKQYAMKAGPVPSNTLDALDGEWFPDPNLPFQFLHLSDLIVTAKNNAPAPAEGLTQTEQDTINVILQNHGSTPWRALVKYTHKLPEYVQTYKEGTSTRIPYELLLELSGQPQHFRLGKSVISRQMRANLDSPFPQSEPAH
jgi:uncharacterized phage-associated protein